MIKVYPFEVEESGEAREVVGSNTGSFTIYNCRFLARFSVCLFDFVVVLRHSNSISAISWQWYDVWDEYTVTWITESLTFRHGTRGTDLWWCISLLCKVYRAGKWIAAQLNDQDQDSYPCAQGHIPHTPTKWANLPPQSQYPDTELTSPNLFNTSNAKRLSWKWSVSIFK